MVWYDMAGKKRDSLAVQKHDFCDDYGASTIQVYLLPIHQFPNKMLMH